jgi:lipopolysaccharide/colanic/teichoic acid biosynthesis glycosyltransferase
MKIPAINQLKKRDWTELFSADFKKNLTDREKTYGRVKRFFDLTLSLIAIIVLSPFFVLIAVIIKVDSPGKALFVKERVGLNGKLFTMCKFRTMHQNVKNQEFAPTSKNDPRVTRFGKFLRRTSLDELPQLLNIILGQMSIVGPRPEMKFIVDSYSEIQKARLLVLPGLTGLWQIYGRKDLPLHENVEYDLYYILHRTLWMDFLIVLNTVKVVIEGKGAY